MFKQKLLACAISAIVLSATQSASAAIWSDTHIGYRYGTEFREPVIDDNISKNIFNLQHASGYTYGTNFFNLDVLLSDRKDPISPNSDNGAQEAYLVYRHTLDFSKVFSKDLSVGGFIRSFGVTAGFDANSKNDAGYNSSKRMLVFGPTVMFEVPGFLNLSLVQLWESNAPYNKFSRTQTQRYHYDPHPALFAAWGINFNVASIPLQFNGYANYISEKGKDEFGNDTKPELNFDGQVMYDLGDPLGMGKNVFKVGFEYQYWHNKFGNNNDNPFFQDGAKATTPMFRTEYHF